MSGGLLKGSPSWGEFILKNHSTLLAYAKPNAPDVRSLAMGFFVQPFTSVGH